MFFNPGIIGLKLINTCLLRDFVIPHIKASFKVLSAISMNVIKNKLSENCPLLFIVVIKAYIVQFNKIENGLFFNSPLFNHQNFKRYREYFTNYILK